MRDLINNIKMTTPNTIVIVGGEKNNQAKLQTQLKPIRLNEQVGLAVSSIYHGEVFNVNNENNSIEIYVQGGKKAKILSIPVGYYPSTAAILRQIEASVSLMVWNESEKPVFDVTQRREELFVVMKNMAVSIEGEKNSLWRLIGVTEVSAVFLRFKVQNVIFENNVIPAFLYVNIVENSYINGKLSRVLDVIPISMKANWSFHEFSKANFVPIDVKEFSKITLEVRDMNGDYVAFNPAFKTIVTLHIKPIYRGK